MGRGLPVASRAEDRLYFLRRMNPARSISALRTGTAVLIALACLAAPVVSPAAEKDKKKAAAKPAAKAPAAGKAKPAAAKAPAKK